MTKKNIISCAAGLFAFFIATGQELERQVMVTKDFEPVVRDAQKIATDPQMVDTVTIKPDFKYTVYPIPAKSNFQVDAIKPAKLVGVPISELYNYKVIAGIGNHHWPLLELYANNLRDDDFSLGSSLTLNNVRGKVELDNGQKITAASSDMKLMGFAKKFYGRVNLEGNMGIETHSWHHYGLATDTVYVPLPYAADLKQRYSTLFLQAKVLSTDDDARFNYLFNISEAYTWDKYDFHENDLRLGLQSRTPLSAFDLHIDGGYQLLSNNLVNDTLGHNYFFSFSPYIGSYDGQLRYRLGLSLTIASDGGRATTYLHPNAGIEYSLAGSILTTFFDLNGKLSPYTYQNTLELNPFLAPGKQINPSNIKLKAVAGIKGYITKTLSYSLSAGFNSIEDQPVFHIDTTTVLKNYYTFSAINLDKIRIGGGIKYDLKDKFLISLNGNTYRYKPESPWHLAKWDMKMFVQYLFREKIAFSGNLNIIGERIAPDITGQEQELKPFAVFDFQMDYRFSKALSAFVAMKNLNAAQYDLWLQYPYYKTMVIFGGAYSF
jgi:hypothetical protein